ncbi:MAG: formyltetrahydrofolate deformylase [Chloroflexi bacterium RBG_16_68_14]|nr:MAG: formyltetrahydrofolate deformylase [Chloroflexi bacterium RBG_16_68_14]
MSDEGVTAVLLLSCPDQKGLVAAVSDFLYRNDGNIIHADQHTDQEESIFLQRVEWELAGSAIAREEIGGAFQPIAERFGMTWSLDFSDYVPRIALFASRLPHCLYDLLARWRMGEFRAEVPLVVSNHADLRPIAEDFGVAFHSFSITPETKVAQEERLLAMLEEERIDLIVLARYMQVLGERFVAQYRNRIINIHHSFLPAFAGGRPYHLAHERGVKIIGATAHYVTPELDEGPIIEQDVARVSHRDSVADLIRKGRDLEKVVLARAVDLHLRRRILVYGNKTVVFD